MFTLVEAIARYCDGNDVVQALLQHSDLREKLLDSVIKIITEECLNIGRATSELTVSRFLCSRSSVFLCQQGG